MDFKIRGPALAAMLLPALALAMPASAQTVVHPVPGIPGLSDSQEPGSVIIFPKFIKGTVTVDGVPSIPRTEIEIGVVCPKGDICSEHQAVKIRFHWVCGGDQDPQNKFICKETDFDVNATVFEKIVLTPNGTPANAVTGLPNKTVPLAECDRGYLIGWVIRPSDDRPVKFDGLIGDAVLREAGTALAAYNAIPIQADPALGTFPSIAPPSVIDTNSNGALMFDGLANHYQMVTGSVFGDVRYSNPTVSAANPLLSDGSLTLFTLDVKSNRPNNPVFVDLDFFGGNPSSIGNENQLSTFWEFICWTEVRLTDIDANLNSAFMGRKGVFVAAPAEKVGIFGITDDVGPTTLLGLSETTEGSGTSPSLRAYYNNLFNDSEPVKTKFRPSPSPIFLSP
jgi:hypothetical protein